MKNEVVEQNVGLSKNFFEKYFREVSLIKIKSLFEKEISDTLINVKNWYKLAYHYTRKEIVCVERNKFRYGYMLSKGKKGGKSLFQYCFKTNNNYDRVSIPECVYLEEGKKIKDKWTQGIICELNELEKKLN